MLILSRLDLPCLKFKLKLKGRILQQNATLALYYVKAFKIRKPCLAGFFSLYCRSHGINQIRLETRNPNISFGRVTTVTSIRKPHKYQSIQSSSNSHHNHQTTSRHKAPRRAITMLPTRLVAPQTELPEPEGSEEDTSAQGSGHQHVHSGHAGLVQQLGQEWTLSGHAAAAEVTFCHARSVTAGKVYKILS